MARGELGFTRCKTVIAVEDFIDWLCLSFKKFRVFIWLFCVGFPMT